MSAVQNLLALEFLFERWKVNHRLAPFLIMRAAVPHDVVTKKRFPSVTHTSALLSPKEKPNRWTCPKTPLKRPNGLSGEGRRPDGDHAGLPQHIIVVVCGSFFHFFFYSTL